MPAIVPSPQQASSATARFGYLDALRGIAIVGVMFVHSMEVVGVQGSVASLASTGVRGVQLFYMVSAFTLLLSMDGRKAESRPLLNFYVRRFFRIAPLFYLVLFLTWMTRVLLPQRMDASAPIDYLLGLLFLFGFKMSAINTVVGGGWSVAVETTFYAVLPLLRKVVRGVRSAAWVYVVSMLIVTPLSYWLARPVHSDQWAYFELLWFPIELPIFLLGMLLFYVHRLGRPTPVKVWSACALAAGVALIGMNHLLAVPVALGRLPLDGVGIALLFLAIVWHPWAMLVNRATVLLGKISYSLYLLHVVVIRMGGWAFQRYVLGSASSTAAALLYFGVLLIVAIPVSLLSYRFVEQPGILLGRKLIDRIEHRAAGRTVASMPAVTSALDTADGQF